MRYRELGRSGLPVSEIGPRRPYGPGRATGRRGRRAVSTVIPGVRTVRNVERSTALSDGRALTADQLAVLAKHRWQRNFYS